jgi:hypothetical protein
MTKVPISRLVAHLPQLAAGILLMFVVPVLWSMRDFGQFLLGLTIYFPMIAIAGLVLLAWAILDRDPVRCRSAIMTLAVIVSITFGTLVLSHYEHDRLEFMFWYPAHRDLIAQYASRDGIIMEWDSWGMAGMDNDAYLVSDPTGSITDSELATEWVHKHASNNCAVTDLQTFWRGLYLLTTYNCPLR